MPGSKVEVRNCTIWDLRVVEVFVLHSDSLDHLLLLSTEPVNFVLSDNHILRCHFGHSQTIYHHVML